MSARRASPVKIGAFVVGGVALLVAAVLLIGTGRMFRRTQSFVSYFEGSVHGLRKGAPVKFKGVELGRVTHIRIPFWLEGSNPPIAVFYSLEQEELDEMEPGTGPSPEDMRRAVERGLRAQLETDSVVTNVKYIALSIVPDAKARLHEPVAGVLEIPTTTTPLQEIGASVQTLAARFSQYDFEALLDSARETLDAVGGLAQSPELRGLLVSSEELVAGLGRIVRDLEPLAPELRALVQRAGVLADELAASADSAAEDVDLASGGVREAALAVQAAVDSAGVLFDPGAPLALELRGSLRELSQTARAARTLFELLERDPSALLRGRGAALTPER
jgi:paraquat-inducible protein B